MKLSELIKRLSDEGFENARGEGIMLFEHFTGIPRERLLFSDPDLESGELLEAVERRLKREPIQYIIGYTYFYNEKYKVTPDCLIPRQDTEHLVELATRLIPEGEHFIDLCTGSGCIAISTLKNTKGTTASALDISEGALSIARENAISNGVSDRLKFIKADVLEYEPDGEFFAVLSNPPYVTEEEYSALDGELYFEPRGALVGFGDFGCGFYERIISHYKRKIKKEGFIALEIGYLQANIVCKLAKDNNMSYEVIRDYSGNDRVVLLRRLD